MKSQLDITPYPLVMSCHVMDRKRPKKARGRPRSGLWRTWGRTRSV